MLEQLIKLVKDNAGEAIINNPAIPNENNDSAITTAAGSIFDKLKGLAAGGNLESILNLFQGGGITADSPVVNNITSGVTDELMRKFDLDQATASTIGQQLIPKVMSKLVNKTNDPGDNSFDLQSIIGSLAGGEQAGGGILNKIKGLFGG